MADSTNTNNTTTPQQQKASTGLSKSTPLVTVQNVHSGVQTAVTSSGKNMDHPLASPPVAAVHTTTTTEEQPSPTITTPTVASLPTKPKKKTSPKNNKTKPSSSLEDMADDFLSQPSPRTESGLDALLKPPLLPKEQEGMERLRTLVVRRAWGDVLSVCGQMLRGVESSYTLMYSLLIREVNEQDYKESVKEDVVEILTLECHAWLKLRRYNELGREVDKWNFVNQNHESSTTPCWVPWSLRK